MRTLRLILVGAVTLMLLSSVVACDEEGDDQLITLKVVEEQSSDDGPRLSEGTEEWTTTFRAVVEASDPRLSGDWTVVDTCRWNTGPDDDVTDRLCAGRVRVENRLDYESFRLPENALCIQVAEQAVRSLGHEPERAVANGGIDPNWTNRHGIPTVSFGCGQLAPHTVREALDVERFREACRIALRLATATES